MKKLISQFGILFLIGLMSNVVQSLEIDEKLTVRILRLSNTKKTVLANRGLEDGLVVGDHAKFFLTSGVIARGVVVKASPTRSVWSIYRFVDPAQLTQDRVFGIKISTPLKLTDDPTKALGGYKFASEREALQIPLEKGADDLESQLTEDERNDLVQLGGNPPPPVYTAYNMGVDSTRTLEVFGIANFSSLTADSSTDGFSSSGSNSSMDFSLGFEKYFAQKNSFIGDISLYLIVHTTSNEVAGVTGNQTSSEGLEYGLGGSYHFLAHPLSYGQMIGYVTGSFGVGSTTDTVTTVDSTNKSTTTPYDGSSTFASLGGGLKYYIQNGFGGRLLLDYYTREEEYSVTDSSSGQTSNYAKTVSGLRFQFGLSYRF
ncbi:MAG: hypothetical protein ACPGJV_03845 [Bacteriovoracaceae bacterium]